MRVSVSYDLRNPPEWRRDWQEIYRETADHAQLVEELGFDRIWLSGHHFTDDGYGPPFAPMAATIGARTGGIRIGSRVRLLSLHHPLLVAEEMAVLDHLLDGRLDVGVAAGYRVEEFAALGIPHGERFRRRDEGIEIIRRAWADGPVSYDGKHYRFDEVEVQPKPRQEPHPPIWMAGRTPKAARAAARLGCHFLPASNDPEVYEAYFSELIAGGLEPDEFDVAVPFWVTVTDEDPDDVWARYRPHAAYRWGFYDRATATAGDSRIEVAHQSAADEGVRRNELIGDAETVLEAILGAREQTRWNGHAWNEAVLVYAPPPGLPLRDGIRSYELFAAEVLPRLQSIAS